MLLKLTNANPQYDGRPIVINSDSIVTMFEERMQLGTTVEQTVTNIYLPPHGTWQVKERLEDICAILASDPTDHLLKLHQEPKRTGITVNPGLKAVGSKTKKK